ncbi:MAG TPA: S46 family peptidase, partial [Bacteroidales bacterium]|nr:S46 family peptidase [Bacteroidales bacterium]
EKEFQEWADADQSRKAEYGNVLPAIQEAIAARKPYTHAFQYLTESFFQSSEIFLEGLSYFRLYNTLVYSPDSAALIKEQVAKIKESLPSFFKDFNMPTDKKVSAAIFKLYDENVPSDFHPEFLKQIKSKYKGDYGKFVENLYKKSFLVDSVKADEFLKKPSATTMMKDPGFKATMDVIGLYFAINSATEKLDNTVKKAMRKYILGTIAKSSDKTYYPDANFTMRLTYGKVGDYKARDAVYYDYYTTLTGVMEKEDSTNFEFNVPAKLKQLYKAKDFGTYGQDGKMRVCFTTNNDITGGNSGSPVINANGELIGLAFDGNWEAMSGDIAYEPDLQKCICVDIRYVLFVMDKFAGAGHLINEMKLVN